MGVGAVSVFGGQVPPCARGGGSSAIGEAVPVDIDVGPPYMYL